VNTFGNTHFQSCGSNERNRARHIWDRHDVAGRMGAMATGVVPWLVDRIAEGATWQAVAWSRPSALQRAPTYSELQFFPKLAAFNIGWHERKLRRITSFAAPPRGRSASAESAH
jgi:hypothetical protein